MPKFTAADGAAIHYTDEGDGRPLLCLAGLSRNGRDFDYLAPHLPPLRLIRMDYRGRGLSDWTGAETYTILQEATDVLGLLDHLELRSTAILGTSRGGLIGMALAATAPDRIDGLCLVDVGPEVDRAGLDRIRDYVGRRPAARSHAEVAAKLEATARGFANVPRSRWLEEAHRFFVETEDGLDLTYDPALREAFLAVVEAPPQDLWPLFDAACAKPLAVIRGAGSDLLSRATADEMARRCPAMIRAEVPDRGHVPFLDEPESLAAIRDWLDRLP